MTVNYILIYSLSLLLYQSITSAEQQEFEHYLAQLTKPLNRLDLTRNGPYRPHTVPG